MYYAFLILLALVTATLPRWLLRVSKIKLQPAANWLPVLAAVLFVVAGFLPDIHISNQTDTFQEHFVGGGLYCACLFVYLKRAFGWRPMLAVAWLGLFAFTCTLGVANELFEFAVTKLGITHIDITDTSWDLAANTLGAFIGYALLLLIRQDRG